VQWALGALTPGATGQQTLTVTVSPAAAEGSQIVATSNIFESTNPAVEAQAEAATEVHIGVVELALTVAASPDPVAPGQVVNYVFTATNTTTSTQSVIQLTFVVPNYLSYGNDGAGTYETVYFPNYYLLPGESDTLQIPLTVLVAQPAEGIVAPPNGAVLHLDASVSSSDDYSSATSSDVLVQTNPAFSLHMIAGSSNFVAPGAPLTYGSAEQRATWLRVAVMVKL
jgi:hypothetical protein